MRATINIIFGFLALFLLAGCGQKEYTLAGATMGTTYQVKVVRAPWFNPTKLKRRIDGCLEQINASMSTYRDDSEISRFNALDAFHKMPLSTEFQKVLAVARKLHVLTDGTWDGTVDPLVNLWGFGRSDVERHIPTPEEIGAALARIGFSQILIDSSGHLSKSNPAVTLDLASIAKGFGVDQVAELLRSEGVVDFLVEIGGEVYAAGVRGDGGPWRVGINQPRREASPQEVYAVVNLHDRALATSGDYRNFFEMDNRRYSHVLDPRRGYPVSNGVVSVSIMATQCVWADGLATAVMVLGAAEGMVLIERLADVEGLVVLEKPDGSLENHRSAGFVLDE
jgi:FAD:protein FMN transferase